MKTIVIGGGGVGSLIASYLSAADRDVTVFDPWFQHVDHVQRHGLQVISPEGEHLTHPTFRHLDALEDAGTAELVVIAVKSYNTVAAARLALPHLDESTIVISAQNGMNDLPIGHIVGNDRMIGSVVELGAHLTGPGRVVRTSAWDSNSIAFGSLFGIEDDPRGLRLAQYFEPLGGVRTVPDIWPERWSKLVLNATSNAPAGLTGLGTDGLWNDIATTDVVIALGHELAEVATAYGITFSPVFGKISHEVWTSAQQIDDPAWSQVRAQLNAMAEYRVGDLRNIASLLQDVLRARRTEIDYLNGWVVSAASRVGVEVPTHRMLVEHLRPVERGDIPPAHQNIKPIHDEVVALYGTGSK